MGSYFLFFVGSNLGFAPIPVMHCTINKRLDNAVIVPIKAAKADTLEFPPGVGPQHMLESDKAAKVVKRFMKSPFSDFQASTTSDSYAV